MPKSAIPINSFNAGELSPLIEARTDISKYASGCRTLENAIPIVEGGAKKMPGTYFVESTKYANQKARLVPFSFSTTQTYILEFGDRYFRFFRNEGQIQNPAGGSLEIITPYAAADLFDLDVDTQSADVLYIFHRLYPPAKVERLSDTSWLYVLLACTGTPDVAKTSTGIAKEITAITKAADASVTCVDHGFTTGGKVYINHVAGMVQINYQIFTITVIDANTFTLGVNSSNYTTYSSGGTVVQVVNLFNGVGDYPSCGTFFEQRLVVAGSDNNPQRINGSVQGDYENFISDTGEDDYAVQFDIISGKLDRIRWLVGQQQLMWGTSGGVGRMTGSSGGALTQSNVDSKKQITTGVASVHPQIANDDILWVTRSAKTVRLLQYIWQNDKWVAPDLTRVARHITKGATKATSGITQTAFQSEPYPVFWAVRADGQLLGMTYESQEQVYAWFRIVTDGYIESVACISRDNDEDEIWIIVQRTINENTVRYVEYFKPYEIFSAIEDSFFVHCGLTWDGGDPVDITNITQANPAVVTAPGHTFVNGDKTQITGVSGMVQVNQDISQGYTVAGVSGVTFELSGIDSSATIGTPPVANWSPYVSGGSVRKVTNEVTGLGHLENKDVVALGDGAIIVEDTVSGGVLSFPYYCNLIHVGLSFVTTIEPMNPNIGSQQGTSRGKKQKINKATLCFYETFGCKIGKDSSHLYEVPFGTGVKPTLFTGDKTIDLDGNWDDEATLCIVHDRPLPFTLKAIIPRLSVNED